MITEPRARFVLLCLFLLISRSVLASEKTQNSAPFSWDQGAVIRGDLSQKRIALVFTGGDYGEGTDAILTTLKHLQIKAGFFVTGGYLRQEGRADLVRRALRAGHYVGPHSDQHPLYCSWDDRDKTLITRQQFENDLKKNINDLKKLGALSSRPVYFIPPYEWFNAEQAEWARQMGVQMFNFSPGAGSNRDYIPESDPRFVSSQKIVESVLEYEKKDPNGLNGYILLLHLGADRKDKMFRQLGSLLTSLKARGYSFVRIDQLLHE